METRWPWMEKEVLGCSSKEIIARGWKMCYSDGGKDDDNEDDAFIIFLH